MNCQQIISSKALNSYISFSGQKNYRSEKSAYYDEFVRKSTNRPINKTRKPVNKTKKSNSKKQFPYNKLFAWIAVLGTTAGGVGTLASVDIIPLPKIDEPKAGIVRDLEEMDISETSFDSLFEEKKVSPTDTMEQNPEIKEQYDKISNALLRFSSQLGEDGLEVIRERVEEIGDGKVEVIDVLKILWIESRGRIYEDDNPNKILKSVADAYGPFQITKDTQDYLNFYFGLDGDEKLDIMDPYDNIDACIYNLRFLNEKRTNDLKKGIELPTGDNIKNAIAWSYHDGAWADDMSYYGEQYVENFEILSQLDDYPEVVEYIINS